jgi:hypothetical protein
MAMSQGKKLSEAGLRKRQTFTYTTAVLAPNASEAFAMELGHSAIVLRLLVSSPCLVEVYGDPSFDPAIDPNPYTFRATSDHLMDDGSTLLRDGTVLKSRQYSIFVNLEDPTKPFMYGQITNNSATPIAITLKIIYLIVEEPI